MLSKPRLLSAINKWILNGHLNEPCRIIVLFHLDAENKTKLVKPYPITPDVDIPQLGSEVQDDAEQDAAGLGDTQKYMLAAYFGVGAEDAVKSGNRGYGGRFTFSIQAAPSFDDDVDPGSSSSQDYSSPKAIVNLAVKMMQDYHRMVVPQISSTNNILVRMLERLESQNIEMASDRRKSIIITEKLLNMSTVRNAKVRQQIVSEQMQQDLLRQAAPALMTGFSNLMGGGKGGQDYASALAQEQAQAGNPGAMQVARPTVNEPLLFTKFLMSISNNGQDLSKAMKMMAVFQSNPFALATMKGMAETVQAGKLVDRGVLLSFVELIGDEHLEAIRMFVTGEEFEILMAIITSFVREAMARNETIRKQVDEAMEGEGVIENETIDPLEVPMNEVLQGQKK